MTGDTPKEESLLEAVDRLCRSVSTDAWLCHTAADDIVKLLRGERKFHYTRHDVVAALAILTAGGRVAWEAPGSR